MLLNLISIHQTAVALAAHTGTVAETSLLSVALPALGANDQVTVSIVLSRPASQSAEATVQLKLNSNLCQRWRIGTNSLVTANSIIHAVAATADATARVTSVVAATGTFTINTVATTAETAFNFIVVN